MPPGHFGDKIYIHHFAVANHFRVICLFDTLRHYYTYISLTAFFHLNRYFNAHFASHFPIDALPKLWGRSFAFPLFVDAVSVVDSPAELVAVFAILAHWLSTFSTFPSEQVCSYLLHHSFLSLLWLWCIAHFSLFIFHTNWEWVHTSYISHIT